MNLSKGSSGTAVSQLQTALQTLGYDIGPSGVDGIFGSDTDAAVRAFQQQNGLAVDGIVGVETADALGVILPNDDGSEATATTPAGTTVSSGTATKPSSIGGIAKAGLYGVLAWFGYKHILK